MHKWSPEDLDPNTRTGDFDPWDLLEEPRIGARDFVEDNPRGGAISQLNRLTESERQSVYDLVSAKLRETVETQIREEKAIQDAIQQQVLSELVKGLETRVEETLQSIAESAVELSIAMSEQIVRTKIDVEPESLINRLSSLLEGANHSAQLQVIVRPEDVDFLQGHIADLEPLNVKTVSPDPKLSPGSCLVTSEGSEWDLTVEGQIDTLSELVRGMLLNGKCPGETQVSETTSGKDYGRDPALV